MANYSKNRPTFKSKTEIYKKSKWVKIQERITLYLSNVRRWMAKISYKIHEKGSQRLTIMLVPHSEKKIVNLQISNYILFFTSIILTITVTTSVIAISNNQQINKSYVSLKTQNELKLIQIEEYKKSIEGVNKRFTMFKGDINNIIRTVGKDKDKDNIYDFNEIKLPDEYSNRNLPKEVAGLEKLKRELDITKENIRRMGTFIAEEKNLLRSMPSIYPLTVKARLSSVYGRRIDPIYRWTYDFHPGLDMINLPGAPILAAADGVVSLAGWNGGYGNLVEIKHKYGFSTRYGHMMRFAPGIYVGSIVKQGQTIGFVGTTGRSTGYHLHYEVRIGESAVDPEPFVSMLPQYLTGVLMGAADIKDLDNKEVDSENKGTDTNSVIGRDNAFSGEFHSNGLLRIDGDYKGIVKGYGVVLVGEKGRIVGDIYARSVRIGGKVKGNIYALDRVDILSTGKLIGDLWTKKCLAEEGMMFTGQGKILTSKELEAIFDKNVKNAAPIITEDF